MSALAHPHPNCLCVCHRRPYSRTTTRGGVPESARILKRNDVSGCVFPPTCAFVSSESRRISESACASCMPALRMRCAHFRPAPPAIHCGDCAFLSFCPRAAPPGRHPINLSFDPTDLYPPAEPANCQRPGTAALPPVHCGAGRAVHSAARSPAGRAAERPTRRKWLSVMKVARAEQGAAPQQHHHNVLAVTLFRQSPGVCCTGRSCQPSLLSSNVTT